MTLFTGTITCLEDEGILELFNRYGHQYFQIILNISFFQCDQCPKRFRYSYQMKLHIRKTHSENHENTVPCISCDKTFRDVINMKKHR